MIVDRAKMQSGRKRLANQSQRLRCLKVLCCKHLSDAPIEVKGSLVDCEDVHATHPCVQKCVEGAEDGEEKFDG